MVELATHLIDHVLPPLPVRQWVLSVPKRIRPFFHHDPALAGAVLRVLLRVIRTTLRRGSPGAAPDAQIGAVSFLHRFDEATHFSADEARALTSVLQRRILRLFQRRGLLDEHTVDDMLTWQGTGGFSVDASVRIHGSDRAGRERLIRYCARPPFALDRLRIEREPEARRRVAGAGDAESSGTGSVPRTSESVGVRRVFYQPAVPPPTAGPSSSSRLSNFSKPSRA